MAENGFAVLKEMREMFDDLGEVDGAVKLRRVTRASAQVKGTAQADLGLYKVMVDDKRDRARLGLTSADMRVFRIWGGAFLSEAGSGAYDVRAQNLRRAYETRIEEAMVPGGGIVFDGDLFRIDTSGDFEGYYRGFTVRSVVQYWYVVATKVKTIR